jgi:hypothetical protein
MAALLAIAGCPGDPMLNRVFRVREDGGVDEDAKDDAKDGSDVVVVVPTEPPPPRPRIDDMRVFARHEDRPRFEDTLAPNLLERRKLEGRTDYRSTGRRPTTWPPGKIPKDRSKAKAARKARKKNRGR